MSITDRYGRPVTGLRISVMPECNFNCFFCHAEGLARNPYALMNPEEIERIVKVCARFGVISVKLTGGEPMMRSDILEIVERLGRLGLRDLSMTTNGFRFGDYAEKFKELGLKRVNISIPTLSSDRYSQITGTGSLGKGMLRQAIKAVEKSIEAGLNPVKVNFVVLRGVNDDEIEDMIDFCKSLNVGGELVFQLIELVNCGSSEAVFEKFHVDLHGIEEGIRSRAVKKIIRELHKRVRYLLPAGIWVEFVKPMHNSVFCMHDTRLRITHDGKFKTCIMRKGDEVEFLSIMRSGGTDEDLKKLFMKAVELREPYWKPLKN